MSHTPTASLPKADRPAVARAYRVLAQQLHPVSSGSIELKIDDPITARTVAALIHIAASMARDKAPDLPVSDNAAALCSAAARLDMAD